MGTPEELYEAAIEKVKDHNFMGAKNYLEKAAEQGDMCSMHLLAHMYNPKPGKQYYKDGTSESYVRWGGEDKEIAFEWAQAYTKGLEKKAESGNSTAMVWLYLFYGDLWSFDPITAGNLHKNDSLATMWLERAFEVENKYAVRHKAVRAVRLNKDLEEADQLFAQAIALGDEGAYFWWSTSDTTQVTQPNPDRFFRPIDLAITNRAPGTHQWVRGILEGFDKEVAEGNEHALPWKQMADSLRLAERLQAIPDDHAVPGSHIFPELRSFCQPIDPVWFVEKS